MNNFCAAFVLGLSCTFMPRIYAESPKKTVLKSAVVKANQDPAQVRIALKLKPYLSIQIRSPQGEMLTQTKPGQDLDFTLRAKINQPNHFYFAGYHVESVPALWKQDLREYAVDLHFYEMGQDAVLESKIGSLEVRGHLVAQGDKVYNLVATKTVEFKDPSGTKMLAVKAGFDMNHQTEQKQPLLSKQIEQPKN